CRLGPVVIRTEIDASRIELGADGTKNRLEAVGHEWRDLALPFDRLEDTAGAFGRGCRSTGLSALESSQIGDRAGHAWPNSDLAVLADLDADRPLEHRQDDLVALAPP